MGNLRILFLCLFIVGSLPTLEAAARKVSVEDRPMVDAHPEGLSKRQARRLNKFKDRIKKKLDKKRGDEEDGNIWSKLSFLLGLLSLAGGIILGILIFANPIGGFFFFLAGLLVAAGVALILLAASSI